jgi:hypothetical protein
MATHNDLRYDTCFVIQGFKWDTCILLAASTGHVDRINIAVHIGETIEMVTMSDVR